MGTPGAVVTIDGRVIEVAAGTGLVEAAAAAGIEIPVFCYEPRIGPAVGACRMCLVEIEGMPKLQTACSTGVRDGMVVATANARAKEAQNAILEFLLLNHPLDCPVCDKGGECPLQDQSYRFGGGTSRMLEAKRTHDKPIPISPLIALDRERCILCYRCTRYSADVTQDGQLAPRGRGWNTMITTFEGRPYEGHFSGNVIELCPVGALTSTQYRFSGRPWDSPDHPTVCGSCAIGCNIHATVREGEIIRILSRRNDAVDEGWLCDRGRFTFPALAAPERITSARMNDRPADTGSSATDASVEVGIEWLHERLTSVDRPASAAPAVAWVLSGNETCEAAYAIQRLAAETSGVVFAAEGGSAAGPRVAATLADIPTAGVVAIIGDADLDEVAPILDLRVRKAVRAGAPLVTVGIGGTRLETAAESATHLHALPGEFEERLTQIVEAITQARPSADTSTVVIVRDGELGDAALDSLSTQLGLDAAGSGIVSIADAANARGLAALDIEPIGIERLTGFDGIVLVGVDPSRYWPQAQWQSAVRAAKWSVAVDAFPTPLHAHVHLVIPAALALEQEGTLVSLDGRLQRLTAVTAPADGVRPLLVWVTGMLRRLGVDLPSHAGGMFRNLPAPRFMVSGYADVPPEGLPGVTGGSVARTRVSQGVDARGAELATYVGPVLMDDPSVAVVERLQYARSTTWITIHPDDAASLGAHRGDDVLVTIDDRIVEARVAISKRLALGHARLRPGGTELDRQPRLRSGHMVATVEVVAAVAASVTGSQEDSP